MISRFVVIDGVCVIRFVCFFWWWGFDHDLNSFVLCDLHASAGTINAEHPDAKQEYPDGKQSCIRAFANLYRELTNKTWSTQVSVNGDAPLFEDVSPKMINFVSKLFQRRDETRVVSASSSSAMPSSQLPPRMVSSALASSSVLFLFLFFFLC